MAIAETTSPTTLSWTTTPATAHTTASFTPPAGSLLVAMVNCGSAPGGTAATMQVSDSLGGTWTLLKRQNTNQSATGGTAEVWCRYVATSAAMTVSVVSTAGTSPAGGALAVKVLTGAAATQPGATAGVTRNDSTTAMSSSIGAGTGNWVYGSAFNFPNSTALAVLGNTTAVSGTADATNNCYWATFKSTAATAGTATYGYSTATGGQLAEAEILAAAATTPRARGVGKYVF